MEAKSIEYLVISIPVRALSKLARQHGKWSPVVAGNWAVLARFRRLQRIGMLQFQTAEVRGPDFLIFKNFGTLRKPWESMMLSIYGHRRSRDRVQRSRFGQITTL